MWFTRGEDCMDLLQMLANASVSAAFSGVVVYCVQLGLQQKAARELELYKTGLQRDMEQYKQKLQADMYKFSLHHQKWAAGLGPLFSKLSEVVGRVQDLTSPFREAGRPNDEELLSGIRTALGEYVKTENELSIFLDEGTLDRLHELRKVIHDTLVSYHYSRTDRADGFWQQCDDGRKWIMELLRGLESELRGYLQTDLPDSRTGRSVAAARGSESTAQGDSGAPSTSG